MGKKMGQGLARTRLLWYTYTMIDSILKAVEKRQHKVGTTAVTALTPIPETPLRFAWTDGSLKGNPGQMGVGYVIKEKEDDSVPLVYAGGMIGRGTNNEAEYMALILAMRHALRLGVWDAEFRSDSLLIVNQVGGSWRVTRGRLRVLRDEVQVLIGLFNRFRLIHVPREANTLADELSRRVVFSEPPLPPLRKRNGQVKLLHDFQAAAIRAWSLQKLVGSNTLSRVFGVGATLVEQIREGRTYRDATFQLPPLLIPTFNGVPVPFANEFGQQVSA